MSIARLRKAEAPHTILLNSTIDKIGSVEALGLFTYLHSKPDNWIIRMTEICKRFDFGKDKYQRVIRELKDLGLLSKEVIVSDDGVIRGSELILHYEPTTDCRENRLPVEPTAGKTDCRKTRQHNNKGFTNNKGSSNNKEPALPDSVDPQAWEEWDGYRKSTAALKKSWSPLAKTKALNVLKDLSVEEQRQAVDTSIMAGWTGLFPPEAGHRAGAAAEAAGAPGDRGHRRRGR